MLLRRPRPTALQHYFQLHDPGRRVRGLRWQARGGSGSGLTKRQCDFDAQGKQHCNPNPR
ncbi:uncharacterized protein MYCGRDRAFT_106132 [Zymoseptoria tritici IPO323]|uniref:Uncharacterized protein n=1 Tax=Zymoseptoria tritici (strain CBS 115943 / IPO323) TaxID=336722 RepID=F9XN54_ZYMTI|nr:uncharacterized protein MYCGRDRAFT_106132 [Zymoseptoria tritici IPO323]EGP83353.1 hypothetical protein MYCGRDRAFT_106132 [Zymoseptoria tritici IPO323]